MPSCAASQAAGSPSATRGAHRRDGARCSPVRPMVPAPAAVHLGSEEQEVGPLIVVASRQPPRVGLRRHAHPQGGTSPRWHVCASHHHREDHLAPSLSETGRTSAARQPRGSGPGLAAGVERRGRPLLSINYEWCQFNSTGKPARSRCEELVGRFEVAGLNRVLDECDHFCDGEVGGAASGLDALSRAATAWRASAFTPPPLAFSASSNVGSSIVF